MSNDHGTFASRELFIGELNHDELDQVSGGIAKHTPGKDKMTTLAVGEEGGGPFGGGLTTLRTGEEGGAPNGGGLTTLRTGEEGGSSAPPFIKPA